MGRMDLHLDDNDDLAVRAAAESSGQSMASVVRAALRAHVRTRPVYDFAGGGESWVRDSWAVSNPMDSDNVQDAVDRLRAFNSWQKERAAEPPAPSFATATTVNAAQIVPPEFDPLLASYTEDRPLYAAATPATITNATSFTLPGAVTDGNVTTATTTGTEGTNPADGTLTFTGGTVTPTSVVGRFIVTREIADSSNPAIDQVALSVLRESYGRQTEQRIFTELNTAQSGTITAGFVPSGAMARTSAGAALGTTDLEKAVLAYTDGRGRKPRSVVYSSRVAVAEGMAGVDLTRLAFRDVSIEPSPRITGTAAGDGDVFILSAGDLFAWSSPLLQMNFYEKSGPALVELALFGYFATKMIAARGLASIRHT